MRCVVLSCRSKSIGGNMQANQAVIATSMWKRPEQQFGAPFLVYSPVKGGRCALLSFATRVCVGAFAKGRSASRILNRELKKMYALCAASGLRLFFIWSASGGNPSDLPSSRFGIRSDRESGPRWRRFSLAVKNTKFRILHLFVGPERQHGFESQCAAWAAEFGIEVVVDSCDKCRSDDRDLCDDGVWQLILNRLHSGYYDGFLGGPPCHTWSVCRTRRPGPPVIRSRYCPYGLKWAVAHPVYGKQLTRGNICLSRALQGLN